MRGGGGALDIFTWGLSVLTLFSAGGVIGMYERGVGGFIFSPSLYKLFARVGIVDGGRVRGLEGFLSLQVYYSSPCYLYRWVGDGGILNPYENEEIGGLPFLWSESEGSGSLGIESLESELEESGSSWLVVFAVIWVISLMSLVSSVSRTFPSCA